MRFVERAIFAAGLYPVLEARRAGDIAKVRSHEAALRAADLLVLGAIADTIRAEEIGDVVRIHARAGANVGWITQDDELDLLRAVALSRILGERAESIGVDWATSGLELAQVALGFGASDLAGPIQKKSGLIVLETETRKVKGKGLVPLAQLKKGEIARLVENAGRAPIFVDEEPAPAQPEAMHA